MDQAEYIRKLELRIDDLEGALKVLHIWALSDHERGFQLALAPKDVVRLCERHFKAREEGR